MINLVLKLYHKFLLSLIIIISTGICSGQSVIEFTDFGVKAGSYENASAMFVDAIRSCKDKSDIVFKLPEGRIDLWPEGAQKKELYISNTTEDDTLSKVKNIGLLLEDFQNVIIEGNNTLIVLHGKMVSFALINSTNVTIKNISFDYERPTMSELTLMHVSDSLIRTAVHPDTKYSIRNGKVDLYGEGWKSNHYHTIIFNPSENSMKYSSWKPFQNAVAENIEHNRINFKGDFSGKDYKAGDVLTIRDPYRDNCGGFISRSKGVRLENVKMHYMHGLGIVSQFSENISLKKVEVAPRKGSGRTVATFADCFHFSGCKGLVEIDSCRTSGAHDDPINVHGTHLKITKIENGNKLTVRFMHPQTYGFEAFFAGDSVAFVRPEDLLIYDFGKVGSAYLVSKREMELTFEGSLPQGLKVGDCLENVSWTPEVVIRNSYFERTNTRGLLITTRRKVLIENNTFNRTGMHAILIANDCNFWYESGPVQDVTIRGNKFIQCGYNQKEKGYAIAIQPETHNFEKKGYIHSNIQIEYNQFICNSNQVLFARSVDRLGFQNNEVIAKPIDHSENPAIATFYLEHCKDVKIEDNRLVGFQKKVLEKKE